MDTDQEAMTITNDPLRQVGAMLRLLRILDQRIRSASPATGSLAELSVLGQVRQGMTLPSQVARALRMDPARVTHLVDSVVADGALTRTPDPEDRRCWRLSLTAAGETRLEAGKAGLRAALEPILASLAPEERAALGTGLLALRRVLDEEPPQAKIEN